MMNNQAPAGEPLPVERVGDLQPADPDQRWLIQLLWGRAAVGMLAGQAKSAKTWLGLEMAVSVASASSALGRFPVEDPGPVLIYLAEDALPQVRARVQAICCARRLDISSLELYVITSPTLRLDQQEYQNRLAATLEKIRPRMLLLDPLVRLHRLDENKASDISWLLGHLRQMQRSFDLAVVLVHHANKKYQDPGRAIRGSSDIYAFADSLAFIARRNNRFILSVQHRFAPAPQPLTLTLESAPDGSATHLKVHDLAAEPVAVPGSLAERLLHHLKHADHPLLRQNLRAQLRVNNHRLGQVLQQLKAQGKIERTTRGWRVSQPKTSPPVQSPQPLELFPSFPSSGPPGTQPNRVKRRRDGGDTLAEE